MKSFLILLSIIFSSSLLAGEALSTNKIKDLEVKALELGKKHGAANVLVALDIDNTTLTVPHDFGSDQWFTWQYEGCIKKKVLKEKCITNNFGKLIDIQGQLFAITDMIPSERTTVEVINNLQNMGFKLILITSRGPAYRNATERSLKKNKLSFRRSAIGPKKGYPSTYSPFNTKELHSYGLTKVDMQKAGLKGSGRPVSYMDGIYMTTGQNKGAMLKALLHKTNTKIKAIIFADDHEKHTKGMQAIFGHQNSGVELVTYRYGAIDQKVNAFKNSEKKQEEVTALWKRLEETRNSVFK